MSLIINHNLSALNTHRNMSASGQNMAKSIEKLSSGYKINVGADDPSGLIISEQLRSQISGLERAVRNSSEAFNLISIAEGALNEMNTILKKMRALAIHAANSGVTSPEQVAADQSEMDSGIETLNRIANTTRYSDQYLLNGQKQLVYDVTTAVNEPTDHALLDTKMTRIDQVFKRDGVKMSIGFAGEDSQYKANTDTSAQRAYLEADNAFSLCEIDGAQVTSKQEFILTGTSGSRLFSFAQGAHVGSIVDAINNVRDSTGIGASLTFASDVRIDTTTNGTLNGSTPRYPSKMADMLTGFDDGTYIYQAGDVQIYGAGLNNVETAKISAFSMTPDAATAFKVGFNCDGDGKIYAKVVDKSTNSIEYYKDKDCTMLIGMGDAGFFAATNNSSIPSSPIQNLDGIFLKLNTDNARDLDVFEIAVIGQRLDNQKDMKVNLGGWTDTDNSVMSGVNLGVNTDPEGALVYEYRPVQLEADGETVKSFEINVYKHPSKEPKYLVATSGVVENNVQLANPNANPPKLAGQTVRVESVLMDNGQDSGLNITLNLPMKGALDGITGETIEEAKQSEVYINAMKELAKARDTYKEIGADYTSAQRARDEARTELDKALEDIAIARKEEEKLRREIDRLQARDMDQQIRDADRDEAFARNDLYMTALSTAADKKLVVDEDSGKTMAETYTDITTVLGGDAGESPEKIAEQVAKRVLDEIDAIRNAGGDPLKYAWEANQDKLMRDVWGAAPLADIKVGVDPADLPQLERDVNNFLNAVYDRATDLELVKEVYDKAEFADKMRDLERLYNAAKDELETERAEKFNYVIDEIINTLGVGTGDDGLWIQALQGDITGGAADGDELKYFQGMSDNLSENLRDYLTDLEAADPTAFQGMSFNATFWKGAKEKILEATLTQPALGTPPGLGEAVAGNSATYGIHKAILSDMYDELTSGEGNTFRKVWDYADSFQDLKASSLPDITNQYDDGIEAETLNAINSLLDSTTGKFGGTNASITLIQNWITANGAPNTWNDIASAISGAIKSALDNAIDGEATAAITDDDFDYTDDVGNVTGFNAGGAAGTLYGDMRAIAAAAAPINTIVAALNGVTPGSGNAALDALITNIWTSVTGPGTSAREFAQAAADHMKLITDEAAAWTAVGNGATSDGINPTGEPFDDIVIGAQNTYNALQALTVDAGGGHPAPLNPFNKAVADALAEQLDILASEGIDITDPNTLIPPSGENTQNLVVNALYEAAIANGGAGAVGEAALKAFLTDVYQSYIKTDVVTNSASADANVNDGINGINGNDFAMGDPGTYGSYSVTADDYAALAEDYPGGGQLPRAEARRDRYLERIENLPLQKAQNSATTRSLWEEMGNDYPGSGLQLTKLANEFGDYVRQLVEDAAALGNTGDNIKWNDSQFADDVHDWLDSHMKIGETAGLWADIQAKKGVAATAAEGAADEAALRKIVEKMWTSVTSPDYHQDVSAAAEPTVNLPFEYEARSPVRRYFDQVAEVNRLQDQLDKATAVKEAIDEDVFPNLSEDVFIPDGDPDVVGNQLGNLVDELYYRSEAVGNIAKEAEPLLEEIDYWKRIAADRLRNAKDANAEMPKGNQVGGVSFTNLGLRVYSVDYGSAETIRIQNKAGNLFYQYRESDSMEKLMVEPDKTVQVAGQDAQISLNGAPIFTTGLVADTTTPDFAGSLVFNAGTLGETSLAIAGYDTGKLFSKATALQGVEENETEIAQLRRSFEPPAMTFPMGEAADKEGMLNETGTAVSLYMDFSQLDPSVEVKINNLGESCEIKVKFEEPDQLTINADDLSTEGEEGQLSITVRVDPANLYNGYYVTDPALKGLFIRTDNLVDLNVSGGEYEPVTMPRTTPSGGNTMTEVVTYATNPRKSTNESMQNFIGGMQFQLGNTEGDQDRTVYSIQSMAMSELGRISWNGEEYCLQNVLGGGLASLTKDPILAMRVLAQAVDDVSTLRARLGAFQSNMLQSNINALGVAVENITKTESAIRDTDMAGESTQFTRFQIMQQAGTSMLAQANQVSQNVLSLLQ